MARTIRLTINSDLEKALSVLHQSTLGTLNTTELIKMAIGAFAKLKEKEEESVELSPSEMDQMSSRLFYEWAKEDGSLDEEAFAHPEKFKPYIPKEYVRAR